MPLLLRGSSVTYAPGMKCYRLSKKDSDSRRAVPSGSGFQHLPEIPDDLEQPVTGRNHDLLQKAAKGLPCSIVLALVLQHMTRSSTGNALVTNECNVITIFSAPRIASWLQWRERGSPCRGFGGLSQSFV